MHSDFADSIQQYTMKNVIKYIKAVKFLNQLYVQEHTLIIIEVLISFKINLASTAYRNQR